MKTNERRGDRGFSIPVLLVGLVIVGLVATVVVIGLNRDDKPTTAECEADRAALLHAEEEFYTQHAQYATESNLVATGFLKHALLLQDVTLVGGSFEVVPAKGCAADQTGGTTPPATTTHLVMSAVPEMLIAGRVIEPAITVTLTDDTGATMASSSADVTIILISVNGAQLLGTTTVRASAGVANFTDLAIDKAGSGYTLAAQASGATVTAPSPVTVTAGVAARLHFVASPPSATPGFAFATQPVVQVEDVVGNLIDSATDPIELTITSRSGPKGSRLSCDSLSVVPVAGVATFTGCLINVAGTEYSLTATTAAGLDGQSERFAVTGAATRLVVVQQPTPAVAGDTLSAITVAIEDSAGNVITDTQATVTITANQHSDTMTGTTSVDTVDGVATFEDLVIATAATGYTLTMAADGLKSAVSDPFDVTTGAAAQLVFTRQPSGGRATKSWSTQPIVTFADASGNVVAGADPITLSVSPGTGAPGAVLTCAENPIVPVDGEARFTKCNVDLPAGDYTLTATSGALSAVSTPFAIT